MPNPFTAPAGSIRHVYISAGHNFFGHADTEPGENPMVELAEVCCRAGEGLEGDRFMGYKEGYKGQITLFAWEVYEDLSETLNIRGKNPSVFRRNIITHGLDLNSLIGQDFTIQGIQFAGTEECRPCYWMNQAFGPGAERSLAGRGGLRARILSDGILRRDG